MISSKTEEISYDFIHTKENKNKQSLGDLPAGRQAPGTHTHSHKDILHTTVRCLRGGVSP